MGRRAAGSRAFMQRARRIRPSGAGPRADLFTRRTPWCSTTETRLTVGCRIRTCVIWMLTDARNRVGDCLRPLALHPCAREESNPHPRIRSPLSCPLDHERWCFPGRIRTSAHRLTAGCSAAELQGNDATLTGFEPAAFCSTGRRALRCSTGSRDRARCRRTVSPGSHRLIRRFIATVAPGRSDGFAGFSPARQAIS